MKPEEDSIKTQGNSIESKVPAWRGSSFPDAPFPPAWEEHSLHLATGRAHRTSPKVLPLDPFPHGWVGPTWSLEFGRNQGISTKKLLKVLCASAVTSFGIVMWLQSCKTVWSGQTAKIPSLFKEPESVFTLQALLCNLSRPELRCPGFCSVFHSKLKSALTKSALHKWNIFSLLAGWVHTLKNRSRTVI